MTVQASGSRRLLVLVVLAVALTACTEEWHTARIGDRDGFGWGTGQGLADAGITSANLIPGTDEYYPVNMTGQMVLGPGDFLPDMNSLVGGNGKRNVWWTYAVSGPPSSSASSETTMPPTTVGASHPAPARSG